MISRNLINVLKDPPEGGNSITALEFSQLFEDAMIAGLQPPNGEVGVGVTTIRVDIPIYESMCDIQPGDRSYSEALFRAIINGLIAGSKVDLGIPLRDPVPPPRERIVEL